VSRIARAGVSAPGRPLDLAVQQDRPGDLIDHAGAAAQLIQPLLGQPEPGVISRVPGSLHPAVAAYHRGRDRDRLENTTRSPVAIRPARATVSAVWPSFSQLRPCRRTQVSSPDRDHARPAQQLQAGLPGRAVSRGSGHGYARLAGQRSSLAREDL